MPSAPANPVQREERMASSTNLFFRSMGPGETSLKKLHFTEVKKVLLSDGVAVSLDVTR